MGWTTSLLAGLAQLLDDGGVGVWNPDGTYTTDQVGITITGVPQQPDRIICLTDYLVEDTPGLVDVTVGVQFRFRGTRDPRVIKDLADGVYDVLHGRANFTAGGVAVAQLWRQSFAQLGPDQNGRWERTDNYYLQAARPTSYNTE